MSSATGTKAIVVDDHRLMMIHATGLLEDAGLDPLMALTAEEAVGLFHAHGDDIALLLTDVQLPGPMDGFELARWAADRWPSLKILVVSGTHPPDEGDLPDSAQFVAKPFSDDVVTSKLRELLAHRT